jgi:arsenate reductase (thioredoxin)
VKKTILVMCVGNSCRSQIAAGWLRTLGGDAVEVVGGGAKPAKGVAARAISVMDEVGIDIRGNVPTLYTERLDMRIDHAIAVCSEDECAYPALPESLPLHRLAVTDPGHHVGTEEEILQAHREVRDELKIKMETFLKEFVS